MNLPTRIADRLSNTRQVLDLPAEAGPVLSVFLLMDVDRDVALRAKTEDEQGRLGVITWNRLTELLPPTSGEVERLEEVVGTLVDWGLLQVVGRQPTDPVLPGSSALRLTFFGRVCLGLAPSETRARKKAHHEQQVALPEEASPWRVWHGASREGLLAASYELVGSAAYRPVRVINDEPDVDRLAGRIAQMLCEDHGVVIDAFTVTSLKIAPFFEELFQRTPFARGPRILILNNPTSARVAAMSAGASLRWMEPDLHGRRETGRFDMRITRRLEEEAAEPGYTIGTADVCGVPDNDLAIPRRVGTRWDQLMLPDNVSHQLDQALMHARFRLNDLPDRRGVPGSHHGYRMILSGLPGTGKSMAAEALASTLNKPIINLDLSSVLSKWLGETEKLLAQVFEVAEVSGAVLVLDEAEALFRQRDSGPGGRDGLGTVVAYLLARLDRFKGVLVATTNRTKDLDEAFFRRFDDFVVLPVPDEPTRVSLWKLMLACGDNEEAPTDGAFRARDDDLDVDFEFLARQFAITGGLIQKAAVRAVAWAEGMQHTLDTSIVLASLARELEKNDKSNTMVFVEPYRRAVQALLAGSPDAGR